MPTRPDRRARPHHSLLVAAAAALALGAGCASGDDDDDGDGSGAIDAAVQADAAPPLADAGLTFFVLTSSAFEDGEAIPVRHTCNDADLSPPLAWSGSPVAAGYALVLTDLDVPLVHSVLWDIPGDATSLPEGIEKVAEPATPAGSKQALAWDGETRGYLGPCPPEEHTYELALYAFDENPLSGVTLDWTRDELVASFEERALISTRLRGTFAPKK